MREQTQVRGPGRAGKSRAAVDSNTLEEQCHPKKIFIGGLSHKTTTQHLRDHFAAYGSIVDAVVLRWPDGRSRGFGYVTFAEATPAYNALRRPHVVGGREVDVKRAVPGTNKLFVGGLPQNTTANELREHFEQYGVVSDAVVMIDAATSRSRGFGFVCFLPGNDGAAAAATSLERYDSHRIRGKWIEVKSAAPPHKLSTRQGGAAGEDGVEPVCAGSTAPSDDADSASTASSVTGHGGREVREAVGRRDARGQQEGFGREAGKRGGAARPPYSENMGLVSNRPCDAPLRERVLPNHQVAGPLGEPKKVALGSGAASSLGSPLKITPSIAAAHAAPWQAWPAGAGGYAPWPAGPLGAAYASGPWMPAPWQYQDWQGEQPMPGPYWPGAGAGGVEGVQRLEQLLRQSLAGEAGYGTTTI